jgi:hypothetical protein
MKTLIGKYPRVFVQALFIIFPAPIILEMSTGCPEAGVYWFCILLSTDLLISSSANPGKREDSRDKYHCRAQKNIKEPFKRW